jgi:hypothetical protein
MHFHKLIHTYKLVQLESKTVLVICMSNILMFYAKFSIPKQGILQGKPAVETGF